MELERKGVTIVWEIDITECIDEMYSPVIFPDEMDGTKWRLKAFKTSTAIISLNIEREEEDSGPEEFGLHYEFFINDCPCTYSTHKRMQTVIFQRGETGNVIEGWRQQTSNSESTTIRCKLWRLWGSKSKSSHFFVQSRLKKENYIFKRRIEKFSSFCVYAKKTLGTTFSCSNEGEVSMKLSLTPHNVRHFDTIFEIELKPISHRDDKFLNFQIFVLDSTGNTTDFGKVEKQIRLTQNAVKFVLPNISKKSIMDDANRYLVNDTLLLQCEFAFWSEIEYGEVEQFEYKTDSYSEEEFLNKVKLPIPYDTILQTDTETFLAHKTILSDQSPVFEVMFQTNMKETIEKCVRLDDIDAETVKRLLVFMYSHTLKNLEWMDAMKLYIAAHKYQIFILKGKCSDFLKPKIDLSNCCVLSLLADTYEDEDMAKAVNAFISEYTPEVLYGDQWKILEKNHPNVAIKTFRKLFLDRRYPEYAAYIS